MNWIEARFKGKQVWAQVDDGGELAVDGGRVPIRYKKWKGARIYGAGVARVDLVNGAAPESLPDGVSADDAPAKPKGKTSRASGFGSAGRRTKAQTEAARQDAVSRIASLSAETHRCFTDGACRGNPGPCGAGAVVKLANGEVLEEGRGLGTGTNNIGELTAIGIALELLEKGGAAKDEPVVIFTDSKYSYGVLCQGWKAKANTELILGLRAALKEWSNLEIQWVAGHAGIPENERADALASAAAR